MRNFVGGLLGVVVGSTSIVIFQGLSQPTYPEPFNIIWFILVGSSVLQSTLFNPIPLVSLILYVLSWIIIGIVIGPFSKPGWNTVRSAIWVGLIHAIFALISLLFLDPEFWSSASRNFDLLSQFATSLILSILTLPSALPIAMIVDRINRKAEPPIPTRIETVCECGAIFKSNPMICSECGRRLNSSKD
jgi:hypothetical protein